MCPNGMVCGNPEMFPNYPTSSEDMSERDYVNYGILGFEHIGTSLLTVYEIVTSDTWRQHLCNVMDIDIPILGAVYVLSIIIIGQFFLMNLILAVIIYAFIRSQKLELEKELKQFNAEEETRAQAMQIIDKYEV